MKKYTFAGEPDIARMFAENLQAGALLLTGDWHIPYAMPGHTALLVLRNATDREVAEIVCYRHKEFRHISHGGGVQFVQHVSGDVSLLGQDDRIWEARSGGNDYWVLQGPADDLHRAADVLGVTVVDVAIQMPDFDKSGYHAEVDGRVYWHRAMDRAIIRCNIAEAGQVREVATGLPIYSAIAEVRP